MHRLRRRLLLALILGVTVLVTVPDALAAESLWIPRKPRAKPAALPAPAAESTESPERPSSRCAHAEAELPGGLPGGLPARKRLGELRRGVVNAGLDRGLRQRLMGLLRAARRALRPPAPDGATARVRVADFIALVDQATGPAGIPPALAAAWTDAANDVTRLLHRS